MYQLSYAEVIGEAPKGRRSDEHEAFQVVVDQLRRAEGRGARSAEAVLALLSLRRLWSALIEDLANPQNELPRELRAALISVGLWVLREAEEIRQRRSTNLRGLIEVNETIAAGLT
jgi:flagellar protein FlaF